ncbi:MAG: hypothetical protein GXO47_10000 [Chlorobi bacterium]|nr:hypothetical protein [Chlorobiota bacterium]
MPNISETTINNVVKTLKEDADKSSYDRLERGVKHAASLWRKSDGTEQDFTAFCKNNFITNPDELYTVFKKAERNVEILYGYFNEITLGLRKPLDEPMGEIKPIDEMFGSYSVGAHLIEDMYRNKIAFYIALNFPYYSLQEKNERGRNWSRKEWAYARLGDLFTSRIPSELISKAGEVSSRSEMYIAEYNIYMGNVIDESGTSLFPDDMVLLSHWNLRDEIKSNYANKTNGLEKQETIYKVMTRIIDQTIPADVINNKDLKWNPETNIVTKNGSEINSTPENSERYAMILNNFRAMSAMDKYTPLNSAIKRAFEGDMEITQPEAEKLFREFLSSKEVKQVAELISKRLGRNLKPWDIWYDGFKARSGIDETKLNKITEKRYPDATAFQNDLPRMLMTLGFSKEKADYIADKIEVDPARGSGHAWGAAMKGEKAHLRTRIPPSGMNYKGYNIAVHEFGHNVEQTISLYDVDYYSMHGVPNTAFTEALAFVFQKKDLMLLGIHNENPQKDALETLDNFWSLVEIMGVSLVDQEMWKWMYNNPDATPEQLKEAVLKISKDTWNKYFAPVFGIKDQTILAIYSHMINSPLYLSNYAFGYLIQFQIEQYLKSSDFATEVERIYSLGRLTPGQWMQEAVHKPISITPVLKNVAKALKTVK